MSGPTFEEGGIQLWLGDCRDVLPLLSGVDAVVTDPPFGIGFAAQPTTGGRKRGQLSESWDDEAPNIIPLLSMAETVSIWGGNYFPLPISRGWLSWFKPDSPPSMGDFELCWTNQDAISRQISHSIAATNGERVGHPTQKPLRVMVWTMAQLAIPEGDTVLDPFMGSGTTGIACIRTGRKFIGIEKDPKHFQTALDRIRRELAQGQLFTPAQPVHEQTTLIP